MGIELAVLRCMLGDQFLLTTRDPVSQSGLDWLENQTSALYTAALAKANYSPDLSGAAW